MKQEQLGRRITRVNDLLILSQKEWSKELGISSNDYNLFLTIQENPGCTQLFLAHKRQVERSLLTRLIKKYTELGYIERRTSSKNKSAYSVYLTEQGEVIAKIIRKKIDELDFWLSSIYTESQYKNMIQLLDLAIEKLEA